MLTPAEVMELRASVKRPGPADGTFALALRPHIIYRAAEGYEPALWELHAYGRLQALSARPEPLLTALAREAAEPGFLIRLLNPALNCEDALLPAASLNARMAAAIAEAEARERSALEADDAAWRARRVQLLDPSAITLEDLD